MDPNSVLNDPTIENNAVENSGVIDPNKPYPDQMMLGAPSPDLGEEGLVDGEPIKPYRKPFAFLRKGNNRVLLSSCVSRKDRVQQNAPVKDDNELPKSPQYDAIDDTVCVGIKQESEPAINIPCELVESKTSSGCFPEVPVGIESSQKLQSYNEYAEYVDDKDNNGEEEIKKVKRPFLRKGRRPPVFQKPVTSPKSQEVQSSEVSVVGNKDKNKAVVNQPRKEVVNQPRKEVVNQPHKEVVNQPRKEVSVSIDRREKSPPRYQKPLLVSQEVQTIELKSQEVQTIEIPAVDDKNENNDVGIHPSDSSDQREERPSSCPKKHVTQEVQTIDEPVVAKNCNEVDAISSSLIQNSKVTQLIDDDSKTNENQNVDKSTTLLFPDMNRNDQKPTDSRNKAIAVLAIFSVVIGLVMKLIYVVMN